MAGSSTVYRRINDGAQLFSDALLESEELKLGMTYYACPKCDNREIVPCNCESATNYMCPKCGWKYHTHRHSTGGDLNQRGLIAKNIR